MTKSDTKSCLIITYGPVPTPQYQTVEGGGMRAWGLAEGLSAHGIDVTVGVNAGFPQEYTEHEGVRLVNWSLDADFVQLMNSFDAVIISYCMGDPSVFVADNIGDDVQLILDVYVPIYIEVSARDSKDIQAEFSNYMTDIKHHNRTLRRGDYFIYANDAQELLYDGVLSALGVINPSSYRQTRLLKTPFGIHRKPARAKTNPYRELGITGSDFVVLWFGGIYPWFRIEEYLAAIKELAADKTIKFVFVGGKNPFNPNPDFSRQYDLAVEFTDKNKLTGKQVFFVDWVDFQDRVDWYDRADVIVSLNQPGEENKFSWRTRVMDYIWGGAVTISNGGDPLSEELITNGAAFRLSALSSSALVEAIKSLHHDPKKLKDMSTNVKKMQQKYFWDVVTMQLSEQIKAGNHPYAQELGLRKLIEPEVLSQESIGLPRQGKVQSLVSVPMKITRKVRQKGVIRSAKIGVSIAKTQLKHRMVSDRQPQFIFISNPINNTGAPVVLLQIVEEYVKKYGANRVRVIAPGVDEPKQKQYLRKLGVTVEQAVFGVGFHFIRAQLALRPTDVVFMNTAAIYDNYRDFIMLWLRNGRLKKAYWFIHEDIAQLPIIHKEFLEKRNLSQIKDLTHKNKLHVLFPSKRTAEEYAELLGAPCGRPVNLQVTVPREFQKSKTSKDFSAVDFLLSGTAADGRKGQVLALSAFNVFVEEFYKKNPQQYRDFKLHLVAVDKEQYISKQVRWIAQSTLPGHVQLYESLPKDEAMEVTAKCNAVICCSLNETFGLYIAEGMLMGHVVLRNDSAGVDEQLKDGINGFAIDHTDIQQFARVIERILNKTTLTNQQLASMSQSSKEIAKHFGHNSYIAQIER